MRHRENEFGIFPKNIRGKKIFYYWVYEKNSNKRRFRSTGKLSFDDAVKFCRSLQIKGQLLNQKTLSFSSYARNFFDYDSCPYVNHRLARGYTYTRSWAKRQKQLLQKIIIPFFGQTNISLISFNDIDNFIMSLKKVNNRNKKLNHIITTLKNIFNFAEMNNIIENNPCKGIKPFKVNSPEKGILTKAEMRALFNKDKASQMQGTMFYTLNLLAASTGMRLGEILALTPQDIVGEKIVVSHSYNSVDGLKSTKNGKTRRINLDKKLKILLAVLCQGKRQNNFIFSFNNGIKPMDHKSVYKRFWKALEIIGIDKKERNKRNITFHSYRHGINTMLLESGVAPETVRLLLGHSPSMTAHYSHLQMDSILWDEEKPVEKLNDNIIMNNSNKQVCLKEMIIKNLFFPDGKNINYLYLFKSISENKDFQSIKKVFFYPHAKKKTERVIYVNSLKVC